MRIIYTTNMKTVVAALIEKDGKYLIAKRKAGSTLGGLWEFPGGKVEVGENDEVALEREILEEFNSLITCFDDAVSLDIVDGIAAEKPLRVVFKDSLFTNDETRINIDIRLRQLSPDTTVQVV